MTKKFLLPVILLAAVFLTVPLATQALIAKSGETVSADEVVEGNFFGAGNLVTVAGVVNGDVFVAGNNVTITGTVNGDVFAAGSSVEISGNVNGNVRAAASTINIRGLVERNILAAGANLLVGDGANVGRHVTFTGASMVLNGPVGGQIDMAGASAVLNNYVGGDVTMELGNEGELTLMSGALLNGDLSYKSAEEAKIKQGARVLGVTDYQPWHKKSSKMQKDKVLGFLAVGFFVGKLISLLSLFIIGLILISLMPKPMKRMYGIMKDKFWPSLGWGLVILILTPVVCILLLFTIVGIPVAVITMLLYAVGLYVAKVIAGFAAGKWITEKLKWKVHDVVSLIIGLIVVMLISLIPIVGWIAVFVLFLWALGGCYQIKKEYIKEMR